jgi:hypothetical protein
LTFRRIHRVLTPSSPDNSRKLGMTTRGAAFDFFDSSVLIDASSSHAVLMEKARHGD